MAQPIRSVSVTFGSQRWLVDGNFQFQWKIAAGSAGEVIQNVFNIISTPLGSQVLFRAFGSDQAWIDQPGNIGTMQAKIAFLTSLSQWEPRAQITNIQFAPNTVDYINGKYMLAITLNIDLSQQFRQLLMPQPPVAQPVWVIDGPSYDKLTVQHEVLTV